MYFYQICDDSKSIKIIEAMGDYFTPAVELLNREQREIDILSTRHYLYMYTRISVVFYFYARTVHLNHVPFSSMSRDIKEVMNS